VQTGKELLVKNNTMSKVRSKNGKSKNEMVFSVVNPYSAGIDVGDREHMVAVPEQLARERVRKFGTLSCDLELLLAWLKECGIRSVAMESTGVYWKPLFSILIRNGLEVYLVNASHVKNVTGRKTDESDAMWIQRLHSCGLLKSSYLPDGEQEALRTLVRYRKALVQDSCRFVNRIQKSLELMNIKFHTVISDITGKTGKAVIEAIISGERNGENFLTFIDKRIKAEREVIVKSLEGNWQPEHLFTLKESYEIYKVFEQRIRNCDKEIERQLIAYEAKRDGAQITQQRAPKKKVVEKQKQKNAPRFDVRRYLERIHGVDVMSVYGLSHIVGLELLAETGTDLSKWVNEKHFVSWLKLCPNNKISGGKLISSKLLSKKPNPAGQAFRQAANAVQKSDHYLGDYFRRMKAKGGNKYAIVATANKIATIYYKMIRNKEEFKPIALEQYRQKYKQAKIAYLERKLRQLQEVA
jgi:transposase